MNKGILIREDHKEQLTRQRDQSKKQVLASNVQKITLVKEQVLVSRVRFTGMNTEANNMAHIVLVGCEVIATVATKDGELPC